MIKRYKTSGERRAYRTRAKLKSLDGRPRLSVFKSSKYIYAQVIDDAKGTTLASAFGKDPKVVGSKIAQDTKKSKVTKVKFDRGSYSYHGQIQQLATAAREAGLQF